MDFFLPDKKREGKLRDRHLITYCVDIYLGLARVIDVHETTSYLLYHSTPGESPRLNSVGTPNQILINSKAFKMVAR